MKLALLIVGGVALAAWVVYTASWLIIAKLNEWLGP